jgi:hypothetical protein
MDHRTKAKAPEMTAATRQRIQTQLADPNVSDQQNPLYLFSLTSSDLLLAIAGGLVDPGLLARQELASRGLDLDGTWVGFDRAREILLGDECAR